MRKRICITLGAISALAFAYLLCQFLAAEAECRSVKPGMTADQVAEILGPITDGEASDGGAVGVYERGLFLKVAVGVSYSADGKAVDVTVYHRLGDHWIEYELPSLVERLWPSAH